MKKNLALLAILVLAICLVSFAFDRIAPASPVHAAPDTQPVVSSVRSIEQDSTAQTPWAQPAVLVITGLVCVLFSVITVSPLLIDDPARLLREANQSEND